MSYNISGHPMLPFLRLNMSGCFPGRQKRYGKGSKQRFMFTGLPSANLVQKTIKNSFRSTDRIFQTSKLRCFFMLAGWGSTQAMHACLYMPPSIWQAGLYEMIRMATREMPTFITAWKRLQMKRSTMEI